MNDLGREEIEQLLAERPELTDDAFTARVMAALALPAPRVAPAPPPGAHGGILFAFAAAACVLAYLVCGGHALPRMLAAAFATPSLTAMFAALALALTTGMAALAAVDE